MLTISFLDDQAYGRNGPKADFDVEVRQDLTTLWSGRVEGHWNYKGWEDLVKEFLQVLAKERWAKDPQMP